MTYDLRPAVDDGKACSTCRCAVIRLNRYDEPRWRCSSPNNHAFVIRTPDETVCDDWKELL